ncbi:hypothetical protein PLEOSDRAFT_157064 [Pleurotus ostreatus PC15]|uniref:DUF1793-domain-containing protein n=1 Tax=Pleurotus ostreatus (strain PC15) TaxID=1137138 RepID=A0A067NYZ1_PLEO1|nr:hypothetical protein PLEOSDRAFT_157064 [Pleurotus ostreatus PC15]
MTAKIFSVLVLLATAFLGSTLGAVTWTATPFNPASVPLAVRSPYLSAWLAQGSGTALNGAWPTFWTGSILGWAGFIKVDGVSFSFLGVPSVPGTTFNKATQKSASFTSTQSKFVLSAGAIDLTVTFLSPVEPHDLSKQSMPFSYMSLSAVSTDGRTHTVQLYSDISAEWVSGDNSLGATWSTTTGNTFVHQVQLANQVVYSERNDHIQQGSAYYATSNVAGTTFQTGADVTVRAQFLNNGRLPNTQDTNFRAIQDNWPVFAFAHDLGSVGSTAQSRVIALGHARDPAVQYIIANNGRQDRSLFFFGQFATARDALLSFLGDFNDALTRANAFDAQVNSDASKISSDYASIVALSIRQAFGATEITISKRADGSFNTDDVLVFMKEISSDGNTNTVDVIFPAWPILLYTNPVLGKFLLAGLFEYQASGQYPNRWSVHDLGAHYPMAIGHNDGRDEAMPVEESGNMLIMTLSYTQKTGDTSLISTYTSLLDQWTQFLISDSLIPANQISTDDFAGPLANQTNLAIKGIVGIGAMAEISRLLGDTTKASNYSVRFSSLQFKEPNRLKFGLKAIATSFVQQWQNLAISSDRRHLTLAYGDSASWGLSYNLFADKLLKLNLFPTSIFQMQTAWYKTVAQPFGVPLDTRHTYTKSDWEIWTAGIMTDQAARDLFISSVRKWASDGLSRQVYLNRSAIGMKLLTGTPKASALDPSLGDIWL